MPVHAEKYSRLQVVQACTQATDKFADKAIFFLGQGVSAQELKAALGGGSPEWIAAEKRLIDAIAANDKEAAMKAFNATVKACTDYEYVKLNEVKA